MIRIHHFQLSVAIIATVAIASCRPDGGLEPNPRAPLELRVTAVTPIELTGETGRLVMPAPAVRVTDALGNPVAGRLVAVRIHEEPFTELLPGSAFSGLSDADGIVSIRWRLGEAAGLQSLTVWGATQGSEQIRWLGEPVVFRVHALFFPG